MSRYLTPVGLVLFMKLASWLGIDDVPETCPSISKVSKFAGLAKEAASCSTKESLSPVAGTCTKGSEAKAGGGLRESVPSNGTGWLPNKFFSKPVCKSSHGQTSDVKRVCMKKKRKGYIPNYSNEDSTSCPAKPTRKKGKI